MKRWFTIIMLKKFFNQPHLVYKLEDKIANSQPVRELARFIVGLITRGRWEIKQITTSSSNNLSRPTIIDFKAIKDKLKQIEEEMKKGMMP